MAYTNTVVLAAGRVRSKKKKIGKKKNKKKFPPSKTHHEIHSSPATAITSRRRAKKHVPRVSPYSPASSIDTGFVEIGLAQLSQSVKTTNVTYRLQTETNKIMAPCTKHPKRGVLPKGKK